MWRVPFVEFSHRRVSGGLVKLGRAGFGVAMHDDNLCFINHLLILPDITVCFVALFWEWVDRSGPRGDGYIEPESGGS